MKTSTKKGVVSFVVDGITWNLTGGIGYQIYLCCLAAFMVLGVYAYSVQANLGLCNPLGDGLSVARTSRQGLLEQSLDGSQVFGLCVCGRPGLDNHGAGL